MAPWPVPSGRYGVITVHRDLERILFSESEILAGIDRLSEEVSEAYTDTEFTVVAVLKGSCILHRAR